MKKQLIVLLAAGILLAYAATKNWFSSVPGNEGDASSFSLPADAVEVIDRIEISDGVVRANLRKTEGVWSIQERDGYPAWVGPVNALLDFMAALPVMQRVHFSENALPLLPRGVAFSLGGLPNSPEDEGEGQAGRPPSGVDLKFWNGHTLVGDYFAGDPSMSEGERKQAGGFGGVTTRFFYNRITNEAWRVQNGIGLLTPDPSQWTQPSITPLRIPTQFRYFTQAGSPPRWTVQMTDANTTPLPPTPLGVINVNTLREDFAEQLRILAEELEDGMFIVSAAQRGRAFEGYREIASAKGPPPFVLECDGSDGWGYRLTFGSLFEPVNWVVDSTPQTFFSLQSAEHEVLQALRVERIVLDHPGGELARKENPPETGTAAIDIRDWDYLIDIFYGQELDTLTRHLSAESQKNK